MSEQNMGGGPGGGSILGEIGRTSLGINAIEQYRKNKDKYCISGGTADVDNAGKTYLQGFASGVATVGAVGIVGGGIVAKRVLSNAIVNVPKNAILEKLGQGLTSATGVDPRGLDFGG